MIPHIPISPRRPRDPKGPVGRPGLLSNGGIRIAEPLADDFFHQVYPPGVLNMALVGSLFSDYGLQPSSGVRSGLHVFVLASIPDMLHQPLVVGDPTDDPINGEVCHLRADLFCACGELDEGLHQQLDHGIHGWAQRNGDLLDQPAALLGQTRPKRRHCLDDAVQHAAKSAHEDVLEVSGSIARIQPPKCIDGTLSLHPVLFRFFPVEKPCHIFENLIELTVRVDVLRIDEVSLSVGNRRHRAFGAGGGNAGGKVGAAWLRMLRWLGCKPIRWRFWSANGRRQSPDNGLLNSRPNLEVLELPFQV